MFYEIKGYWTKTARRKFELFRKEYPEVMIEVVDEERYNALREEYQHQILWEGK